ncbi:MerR family transcriptional regulator [Pseudogracilibacillus auburnensis]|uniref:DNA-binding transcriptional MerR regulator n=1 Tax=Pseudogracilibacillus auburnensis TaxID=1494959 RepID=A0A2V3W841_9BACI|nr:MerR family transcriptional regulator [Pseudogracilibacillus auburnensis]PXW90517.1 DNA-binding transcriptional MerR regulator [Pseudogracilibacillus auburnensis]
MNEKRLYSVGELAVLSGTTIRTIQYYDKINLLKAKRDESRNLRYYTQADLLTLQQILFYKKLGVSLKDIKKYLVNTKNLSEIKEILKKQSEILFQKEMEIKMNIAIIEAIVATLDTDKNYDLEPMMKIALGLNKQSILDYTNIEFDQKTSEKFEEKYPNYNDVIEFYWQWKQLILEATSYKLNNTPYQSDIGYQFGKKWDEFVKNATGNDPEMIAAFEKGLEQSHQWPEEDIFLYNFCNDFIEGTHNYYCKKR